MPKLCEFENCRRRASWGLSFGVPQRCRDHTVDGMRPQYKICKCGKPNPRFSVQGDPKLKCCADCVNSISGVQKNSVCPNCRGCSNKKYKNYCSRCFETIFPNDPLSSTIRSRTKEGAVMDFLSHNYVGCANDCWMVIDDTLIYVEVCGCQMRLQTSESVEKVITIKFNPYSYKNGNKTHNPHISTRLRFLKNEIDKHIRRVHSGENTSSETYFIYCENDEDFLEL